MFVLSCENRGETNSPGRCACARACVRVCGGGRVRRL